MIEKKYKVTSKQAGQRLDLFLSHLENDLTRSFIKQEINSGNLKINNKVEFKPNYRVRENDDIYLKYQEQKPNQTLIPQNIKIDIVYEDNDLLIVNKPVGMVVHPATNNWDQTLMNAVLFYNQELNQVGDASRSGLIHRIDKDTSGIVMIGKNNKALWYYSRQFAERNVHKTYLVVSRGDFAKTLPANQTSILIQNYLGRNPGNRKKFSVVDPKQGKLAETEFILANSLSTEQGKYSLIFAKPLTGRTHQIRVQLAKLGFPILGDKIYDSKYKYQRLMLHAWKIKLTMTSGKIKEFSTDIPNEFKKFFAQ